jgi:hypothetical protein
VTTKPSRVRSAKQSRPTSAKARRSQSAEGRSKPTGSKAPAQAEVLLRITLEAPPEDVTFCLQRGRDELVSPRRSRGAPLSFDFTVRVRPAAGSEPMSFLGPFTQGPPASRFVYVNSGTMAGETATPWTRRAKIPLAGITAPMVKKALADPRACIEARIHGTARDGGPACATCRPLGDGWVVVSLKD